MSSHILTIDCVSKAYEVRKTLLRTARITALDGVSVSLLRGRTLAVVGESGSGKSTLARLIMRLDAPCAGSIRLEENGALRDIVSFKTRDFYRRVQMVFQDPWSSLNPRKRIWQIVSAPGASQGRQSRADRRAIAEHQLKIVGLGSHLVDAWPSALSGGQRQRVGIARALASQPEILILDEPLSALDVSVQSQILNLLLDLQRSLGLTYLFISHDLAVVRHVADEVAVMYQGRIVEYGDAQMVIGAPTHPYTSTLVDSMPGLGRRAPRRALAGESIEPGRSLAGCSFVSRCPQALEPCRTQLPPLHEGSQRGVACFHVQTTSNHECIDAI